MGITRDLTSGRPSGNAIHSWLTLIPLPIYPNTRKVRWVAEANFLKAYYHYWLIRMYGPIPIEDVALPVDATETQVREKQQTVDSCFNYVVSTLDKAIPDLPATIENAAGEAGRITSTIALAVKAEALATEASPLFNGNPDYASFKGKDGKNLSFHGRRSCKMAAGRRRLQSRDRRRRQRRCKTIPVCHTG